MSHLLQVKEGVEVIVDDLVAWRDVGQHDARLRKVLERLKSPNSEPAKLSADRERDAGYSLWLRKLPRLFVWST